MRVSSMEERQRQRHGRLQRQREACFFPPFLKSGKDGAPPLVVARGKTKAPKVARCCHSHISHRMRDMDTDVQEPGELRLRSEFRLVFAA